MIIISGTNSKELAKKISRIKRAEYSELKVQKFPDGELYLRYMTDVKGKEIVIVNTMHPNPNDAMIELIYATTTAKELGAKKVTIIAPYLAYMRQDKRFHPGECKSNTIMSKLLSCADKIITVDPHLHRIKSLKDIFDIKTTKVTANTAIANWIKQIKNPIIIGPDGESYQWAESIAKQVPCQATVLKKKRYSSRVVRIQVGNIDVAGKNVILTDDIISTGNTMLEPIKQLKKMGANKIYCIAVHGLFVEGALNRLKKHAIVLTTNSINNQVSKIDLSKTIADSL